MADNLAESRRKIILNSPHLSLKSGSIVTANNAIAAPLNKLIINITSVQNGTGVPSPTNIRHINGFDDANIKIASKNLMISGYSAFNVLANAYGSGYITLNTTSKTAVCNFAGSNLYLGVIQNNNNRNTQIQGDNYYPFKQNTQYTFIFKASKAQSGRLNIGVSLDGGTTTVVFSKSDLNEDGYIVYTSPVNKTVTSLYVGFYDPGSVTFYYDTFGVYEGVVTYEEHISQYGTTYYNTWQSTAGTVYGGTLDVTNGILTVTHGKIESYNGETLPGEWISDRDVYASGTTPTTGAQVVYELAGPIVYSIAPIQISTLLGTNNIWADTGDISVKYWAHP